MVINDRSLILDLSQICMVLDPATYPQTPEDFIDRHPPPHQDSKDPKKAAEAPPSNGATPPLLSPRLYSTKPQSLGPIMSSGRTALSKASPLINPNSIATPRKVLPWAYAVFAIFAALS